MNAIYTSASKLVFLLMAGATVAGLFLGKIDAKDFMVLSTMSFAYYFTVKSQDPTLGGK
jgi:hypothetical protein